MNEKFIAIRFNVSKKIGLGHLRRCQALASMFEKHIFVVPKIGKKIALDQGIPKNKLIVLTENSNKWWEKIPYLTHIVTDIMNTGNKLSAGIEIKAIAQSPLKLTVIDSMPPDHFIPQENSPKPDLVICPYHNSGTHLKKKYGYKYLNGAKYAMLAPKFSEARKLLQTPKVPRILLTCGGTDSNELSLKILQSISPIPCQIDLLIGPLFSQNLIKNLRSFSKSEKKITFHKNVQNMLPFYQSATLVVGRPGLTRYEAAVFGCHGLYLWDTKGYENYWRGLNKSGIAEIYTSSQPEEENIFFKRLRYLSLNPENLPVSLNERALELVDGQGCKRVTDAILGLSNA